MHHQAFIYQLVQGGGGEGEISSYEIDGVKNILYVHKYAHAPEGGSGGMLPQKMAVSLEL